MVCHEQTSSFRTLLFATWVDCRSGIVVLGAVTNIIDSHELGYEFSFIGFYECIVDRVELSQLSVSLEAVYWGLVYK